MDHCINYTLPLDDSTDNFSSLFAHGPVPSFTDRLSTNTRRVYSPDSGPCERKQELRPEKALVLECGPDSSAALESVVALPRDPQEGGGPNWPGIH